MQESSNTHSSTPNPTNMMVTAVLARSSEIRLARTTHRMNHQLIHEPALEEAGRPGHRPRDRNDKLNAFRLPDVAIDARHDSLGFRYVLICRAFLDSWPKAWAERLCHFPPLLRWSGHKEEAKMGTRI
jgi:hypothetical protein